MSEPERWRRISDFPSYLVSSQGRVYNEGLTVIRSGAPPDWENGNCFRGTRPHELRPKKRFMTTHVHRRCVNVLLSRDRKQHRRAVKDLMAAAFLGPTPPGFEVGLKNGVKTDLRLENLCYQPYEGCGAKTARSKREMKGAAFWRQLAALRRQGLSGRKIAACMGRDSGEIFIALRALKRGLV